MTFSIFAVIMILIVALVAFIHSLQGFFSATISAIIAVFAAVLALSYHETIVEKFLGGAVADSAHAMVLVVLFATIYFVLRVVFDQVIPGNVRLPSAADKTGGAVMGVIAGIFAAGILAIAAQEMSLFPAVMGYARYAVDDHDVRLPTSGKTQDSVTKDQMNDPTFDDAETAGDQQKMLLPVDDIVVNLTSRLSSSGALSAGEPLSTIHPNWLQELFGQRLGSEPGAKRVLLGNSTKGPEARVDNLYLINQSDSNQLTDLACLDGEYTELRGTAKQKMPPVDKRDGHFYYAVKPNHFLIVARIRFTLEAGDKLGGGLVRIGPGNIRLVAPGISSSTGELLDHVDYYPIGVLQYKGPHVPVHTRPTPTTLYKPVLMMQNADDYLYIKKDDSEPDAANGSNLDAGADFVFSVYKNVLTKAPSGQVQIIKKSEDEPHPFIEIKRLVREDINGHLLLSEADLQKDKDSIAVIRRDKLLMDQMVKKKDAPGVLAPFYPEPVGSDNPPTPAPPPPPTPTPTPTPAPTPSATASVFPLDIGELKLTDQFYTNVAIDQEGDRKMSYSQGASGSISVENGQIHVLAIDGALPADMRNGAKTVKTLATPLNMTLVQVTGKPKADPGKPWSWKEQFNDLALVDASGAKIGPPVGAWAQYTDGGTKVSAQFNVEGGVKVDDIKPAGELKEVWFVFAVPKGTKIAKVAAGGTTLSEQALEVP